MRIATSEAGKATNKWCTSWCKKNCQRFQAHDTRPLFVSRRCLCYKGIPLLKGFGFSLVRKIHGGSPGPRSSVFENFRATVRQRLSNEFSELFLRKKLLSLMHIASDKNEAFAAVFFFWISVLMAEFLVIFRDMIEFPPIQIVTVSSKVECLDGYSRSSTLFPMFSMVFYNLKHKKLRQNSTPAGIHRTKTVQVTVEAHGSAVPRGFERHRSSSRSRVFALIARSAMRKPVAGGQF